MAAHRMSEEKDLAYRYDLMITPDWRDRFDTLVNEALKLPNEGIILDVNCGTGAHTIEIAERLRGRGEIIGIDPSAERIEIARAKAQIKKNDAVTFEEGEANDLPFSTGAFELVIGDASMVSSAESEAILDEMMRVTQPGGRVVLKITIHGSFDELFSIYWEALLNCGLIDESWSQLERLINERLTISDARTMAEDAGLMHIETFSKKEEFLFASGEEFITSPIIKDIFLTDWLGIVPAARREEVLSLLVKLIDDERHGAPFDVSIKATLITGVR